MTEIEALKLRSGDIVVCKPKNGPPSLVAVYEIHSFDLTPQRAMSFFGYDPVMARKASYDGPIVETMDHNGHRTLWPSFLVERPDVLIAFPCQYCERAIELMVSDENHKMWLMSIYPIDQCFPKLLQMERDCIRLKACGYCQKRIVQDEMRRLRKENKRKSRRILPRVPEEGPKSDC